MKFRLGILLAILLVFLSGTVASAAPSVPCMTIAPATFKTIEPATGQGRLVVFEADWGNAGDFRPVILMARWSGPFASQQGWQKIGIDAAYAVSPWNTTARYAFTDPEEPPSPDMPYRTYAALEWWFEPLPECFHYPYGPFLDPTP